MTDKVMSRVRPRRYVDSGYDGSSAQESRIASRLGGKRVKGSGASMFSKGDVRGVMGPDGIEFLVEAKTTSKASISITWKWLRKITSEAQAQQCYPALSIEIGGGDRDPMVDRDWVCIPADVFGKLLTNCSD
jgi:hypothetical protein